MDLFRRNFSIIFLISNIVKSFYNVIACVILVIVKASSGPRYVVGCRSKVDKEKLTAGTRVVLDMTTLTIMRALPREVSYYCMLPTLHRELDREKCIDNQFLFK